MPSIFDWSKTADDNGASDAVAPWPEGMARRQVNNSARGMMKRVAELRDDISAQLPSAGTANALTITPNSDFTSFANGRLLAFRSATTNTGAATLNVNGLGAKAIRKFNTTGEVDLDAGDIQVTGIYIVMYSTTQNGGSGAWCLLNPPATVLRSQTQQTASGNSIDFTGIPAGAQRITLMLNAVSVNANLSSVLVHIGDAGGIESTGYAGTVAIIGNGGFPQYVTLSSLSLDGFYVSASLATADTITGQMLLTRINTLHRWIGTGQFMLTDVSSPVLNLSTGNKATSAEVDRVRIVLSNGAASFDGGTVNIMYE